LEFALVLVVDDLDVEVLKELSELWRLAVGECVGQVRHGGEHGLDRVGMDIARRLRFQ